MKLREFAAMLVVALRLVLSIRKQALAALFALSFQHTASAADAEPCPLEDLDQSDYTHIDCQFYLGTTAYRTKFYEVAAAHWKLLQHLPVTYVGDEQLIEDAKSNLAFLQYNGLGIERDRATAIAYWRKSALAGSNEAPRHLGFAYSDDNGVEPDFPRAMAWYQFAIRRLSGVGERTQSQENVLEDARDGIRRIEGKMTRQQIEQAEEILQELIGEADA